MNVVTNESIKRFKAYLYEEEKSENTIKKYIRDVRAFCGWLGEAAADKAKVLEYKHGLCESYAPKSVNSMLSSLNAFFEFTERHDLKEMLASTALKDEYILAPNTHAVLLLNKEEELYFKAPGSEKSKIASDVLNSSYCFSKDESTIAFLVKSGTEENPTADLYIQKIGQEKEKVAAGLKLVMSKSDYKISADASNVLYLDAESVLYSWSAATADKEKLAGDVTQFEAYDDNNAYCYSNSENVYYVKFSNDTEAQRISSPDIGNLTISKDGLMAVFTGSYNWEKNYGELYSVIKGGDAVKIASNVNSFNLAANNNLYYVNDENALYLKKMPQLDENTYKNASAFIDKVNNGEKKKIGSDVVCHEISPNGKNISYIDNDGNLYLSYDEGEKVKAASDVTSVKAFDDRLIFVNKDNQLYLNSVIKETENLKDNNKMVAQMLNNFCALNGGRYIMFTTTESNALTMIVDGGSPQELINDCNSYDIVLVQNKKVFEKKLLLSDIAGIYKNSDLGVAYKITSDKKFTLYEKGEEKETSDLKVNGINRLSAELKSDNQDSVLAQDNVVFSVTEEGAKEITVGGVKYSLELIDDAGLEAEIERQKKAEADAKAAAERQAAAEKAAAELQVRKDELAAQGRKYMQSDVYVSSYETLYYSANYGSASGITYTVGGYKSVYDYEVSSDGYTLWLKLYTTSSSYDGYSGYVWVAR